MDGEEQHAKSRVVKVESEESWHYFITTAKEQGCPVLIHFSASWCVPSLAMNSYFEEMAMNYQGILFITVDVDEVTEVASAMEVKAMPTFVLMKDGEVITKMVGANPDEIRRRLDGFVPSFRPAALTE